ncbi:c-type cytochrome [Pelagicoccus mobilis]|uniref:C-type cytochrome n=1 Tax=Pelagicoccus mobilis TaxID=415221 RepID=A0A934VRY7_9BACT|nr:c-type cytochrome [Pelagicoccus mobilis]MBK1879892.1 c-type cytochrome [Pelagicoccus mobilis]
MRRTTKALLLAAINLLAAAHGSANETDELVSLGKSKFELMCMACHKYEHGPNMLAPPAFAVQMHYENRYGEDEKAFRKAIVDWAKSPDPKKALMPGAIRKFKVMPPLPLPDADLDAIAAYLYHSNFEGECDPAEMERNRSAALQPASTLPDQN